MFKKNTIERMSLLQDYDSMKLNLENIAEKLIQCHDWSRNILIFGNGGSAADALHMEAELVGRFKKDRAPIKAKALGSGFSSLTAIANDYGYGNIFSREVEAYANKDDILIGITTSGKSPNVLEAFRIGCGLGTYNIAMTGKDGVEKDYQGLVNLTLGVNSSDTARVQEIHGMYIHDICEMVEEKLFGGKNGA